MRSLPATAAQSALRMLHYFTEMLADAERSAPRDDLTGALLAAEIDGDRLSDREIIGFLFLMIDRRQRDHDEAARQRALLAVAQPGRARSPARATRR